jgi:hypothetical protein
VALAAGQWYWRLSLDRLSRDSAVLSSGQFIVTDATGPELISPPSETTVSYRDELPVLRFQWQERKEALSYLLEISGAPDFSDTPIRRPVDGVFFVDSGLGPGTWYWRVLPVFPHTHEGAAAYSAVSVFHIEQQGSMAEEQVIEPPRLIPEPEYMPEPEPVVEVIPLPEVRLLTPAQVLPIPILPAPENRRPVNGYRIGTEDLRTQRNISFTWSAVSGANGYIVTVFQETNDGRRRVAGTDQPITRTGWTLDNLSVLDRGTFVWQVEAVNTAGGRIDQRGRSGENSFIIDIPRPGQVRVEEPAIVE